MDYEEYPIEEIDRDNREAIMGARTTTLIEMNHGINYERFNREQLT